MYLERYTLTVLFNLHIHDVCTPMCGCFTLSQDEGYCLQLRGEPILLHGAVVAFCGHTPASCYVGGFKEGVEVSLRKCRRGMATLSDVSSKVSFTTLHIFSNSSSSCSFSL